MAVDAKEISDEISPEISRLHKAPD